MKIGLDASEVVGRSGIATYAQNLVAALLENNTGREDRYYLFSFLHEYLQGKKYNVPGTYRGKSELRASNAKEVPSVIAHVLFPFGHLGALNDFLMRWTSRFTSLDIMHFTNPLNIVRGNFNVVVTVHDLAPLHEDGWVSEESRRVFRNKLEMIKTHADACIAVSEYTKREMVNLLGMDEKKITVVHEAPRTLFLPDLDKSVAQKYVGESRFVLYAGQLQPRKNLARLIDAFAKVAIVTPDVKLVLVGKARDPEYFELLAESISAHGLSDAVIFAGSLDDHELRKLYSTATCVAYPSLFEGFGLPVIEAMACGAAVLTSNTTSIPEVAGDAAVLVDPYDEQAIADGLIQILTDENLRETLCEKALIQAARFSWKRAAEETHAVYERVGNARGNRA